MVTGKKTKGWKKQIEIKTLNEANFGYGGWIRLKRHCMDKEKVIGKSAKLIVKTNDTNLKKKTIYFRFKHAKEAKVLKEKMNLVLKKNGDIITQLTYDPNVKDNTWNDIWKATVVAYLEDGTIVKETTFVFKFEGK